MADVVLRSPYSGGVITIPPEHQIPAFLEALRLDGFTPIIPDPEPALPPKRPAAKR